MSDRLRQVLLYAKVLAIELRSFIKDLKVSWLRRILNLSKPNEWTYLSLIKFMKYSPLVDQTRLNLAVNYKVSKGAKIRNRYNQVPHLTQDTNLSDKLTVRHHKRERRGQPFPSR